MTRMEELNDLIQTIPPAEVKKKRKPRFEGLPKWERSKKRFGSREYWKGVNGND